MVKMSINYSNFTSIFKLNNNIWKNTTLHLQSKGAMRPWLFRNSNNIPLLIILPDSRQVRDFYEDSQTLGIFDNAAILPEFSFNNDFMKINALKVARGKILEKFRKNIVTTLVTTPSSLMSPYSLNDESFDVKVGDILNRNDLINWLNRHGYQSVDLVWTPGQFAVRGCIVDIYSPSDANPTRIEFYDDTIESIRFYNSESQKSIVRFHKTSFTSILKNNDIMLNEFFSEETHVVQIDPLSIENMADNTYWLWTTLDESIQHELPLMEWDKLSSIFVRCRRVRIVPDVYTSDIRFRLTSIDSFKGKNSKLKTYVTSKLDEHYKIYICTENAHVIEWAKQNEIKTIQNILSEGFDDPVEKVVYLSDLELSGVILSHHRMETSVPTERRNAFSHNQLVIHDDYGIGKYIGTESIKRDGVQYEYIILEYADERRLLMPIQQINKISAWDILSGEEEKLDNLKSSRWKKSSEKAKELAQLAAKELVKIYATRELTDGFSFKENEKIMHEVEMSFPYTETADQLRAFDDIKDDMMSPVPMDRLLVGDVGFGKTEVAIRAAARAIGNNKQVAVMVPTTLLAHQHYETFLTRFADIPVNIRVVSRFVPQKEQKEILEDLACGKIDIIIGTHRLISKDVKFKNLGLVVIDEEHRFGVMNKEHMKELAPNVDVLMLSATPIPRSLSLSLSGLRDISILATPPSRRLPVITVVSPLSERMLTQAILREVNRGGQVFFVHNRIQGIQKRVTYLKRLFPNLNVAVVHSRMHEQEIENTMFEFSNKKIDILVATTIIESGLDIPSANTLIVDDAHELGLAQMYQLRGRVGRSEEQAYAFLMYPADAKLTNEARERLEAIAELDELGAGYKLAQRDLRIRGGGELIGVAQHGNIGRIGYNKYCDLLSEEISRLKGTEHREPDVVITLPLIIPANYIPQESVRVSLYRRISYTTNPREVLDLIKETTDRFGMMPIQLQFLLAVAYLKSIAYEYGIFKINVTKNKTVLLCEPGGKWQTLKRPSTWFRKSSGFLGDGGYTPIVEFYKEIVRTIE